MSFHPTLKRQYSVYPEPSVYAIIRQIYQILMRASRNQEAQIKKSSAFSQLIQIVSKMEHEIGYENPD